MTLEQAYHEAKRIFGEDGVAMIGKLCEVGRWADPDRGCGGDFLCLGAGETFEAAFDAVGIMEPKVNP